MRIPSADVPRGFSPDELSPTRTPPAGSDTTVNGTTASTFSGLLGDAVSAASNADRAAEQKVQSLAAGASDDIHGTMIAVKEADISVKLVATIRNRLVDAFHELWRTSV